MAGRKFHKFNLKTDAQLEARADFKAIVKAQAFCGQPWSGTSFWWHFVYDEYWLERK